MTGARRRESFAERRDQRAGIEDPAVVLEAALRFLEARPRSVAEVRRRLTTAGYRSELVGGAIERLVDLGVLDDAGFARTWVESRDRAHPRGELALRRELALKGIDRAVVDSVLAERAEAQTGDGAASGHAADEERARRLVERNRRTLEREPDPRRRRARGYALLARNGFDSEIASRVATEFVTTADAAGIDEE